MSREPLAARRRAEVYSFAHGGRKWTATISRFGDGRLAEIFLDAPKATPIAELAAEAAIVASLALQPGCPLSTLRHALDGRGVGPLGAALALIDGAAL